MSNVVAVYFYPPDTDKPPLQNMVVFKLAAEWSVLLLQNISTASTENLCKIFPKETATKSKRDFNARLFPP